MVMLRDIGLFMLDMDGTFYLGDELLPGAVDFLAACRQRGVRYTFLTNNSSKSAADYIAKLARLGVAVRPDEMLTSGDATLDYLKRGGYGPNLLLIGTHSLHAQFRAAGFDPQSAAPQAVVLGFDTAIDYPKLTALCNAVRAQLPYIATHPDRCCPVPGGFIPDTGAVIAFVQAATGRLPDVVVGKPNGLIAQAAASRAQLPLAKLCMVGDRLYTDIALCACGVHTALVLCGESSLDELAASTLSPNFVFRDLADMTAALLAEPA